MAENNTEVFDWNEQVGEDVESKEFTLLPDGNYDFAVAKYEKKEKEGKDGNIIPQVILTLVVQSDAGQTQILDFIELTAKMKWRLSSFLRSVGIQKKGQSLDMSYLAAFDASVGQEGKFQLNTEEYKSKKYNRIKKYFDKEDSGWKPGAF
ncbi:hypothetical protein AB840_10120 [Megasphaera cerevisiae DSM 20462]|uniref:DUF669 domain-containing protein n=1 Tax=Megasphaera cerevisiae DSM 20462 TaxID=1122219 RepID=A0A0J6WV75_9FIRM|nr:DUF669 domain-containing protein [Megasphaera cerevisiae]KMO86083.1 hypothetical protein AB840_10120 [Megasphaera cerevisiae DSM 20462]SKA02166.1 Protein of unknown function [Megasphaera cerevisiae DSM 20462]